MDCSAWYSTMNVNREALKEELQKSLTDPRLMLLESKDYDEMIDVFADAFLEDPLALYVSGLDGLEIDATKKKRASVEVQRAHQWLGQPAHFGSKQRRGSGNQRPRDIYLGRSNDTVTRERQDQWLLGCGYDHVCGWSTTVLHKGKGKLWTSR